MADESMITWVHRARHRGSRGAPERMRAGRRCGASRSVHFGDSLVVPLAQPTFKGAVYFREPLSFPFQALLEGDGDGLGFVFVGQGGEFFGESVGFGVLDVQAHFRPQGRRVVMCLPYPLCGAGARGFRLGSPFDGLRVNGGGGTANTFFRFFATLRMTSGLWRRCAPHWIPAPYRSTGHAFAGMTMGLLSLTRWGGEPIVLADWRGCSGFPLSRE